MALHKVMIWSFIDFGLITVSIIINLNIDTSQYIMYNLINYKLICVKSIFFYNQTKHIYFIGIT